MSYKGKVVLRAVIRLTKGTFGRISENKKTSLRFADFMTADECNSVDKDENEREKLTLFLESSYISGLPENLQKKAIALLVYMMRKKATQMGAILAVSISYHEKLSEEFSALYYSMYISKSKAGEQYLDSLGGNNRIDREGSYRRESFLFDKKDIWEKEKREFREY